jgi:hypothetical protein
MRGVEPDDRTRDAAELPGLKQDSLGVSLLAYFFCATTPAAAIYKINHK